MTITGAGFPPSEWVNIYLDQPTEPGAFFDSIAQIDNQGNFVEVDKFLPATVVGTHNVCADTANAFHGGQQYAARACSQFLVRPYQPQISLSASSGLPGIHLMMTGSGFPPGALVGITLDGSCCGGTPGPTANLQGALYPYTFFAPGAAGPHEICGDTGYREAKPDSVKACAQFVVEGGVLASASPDVAPSPTPLLADTRAASRSATPGFPIIVLPIGLGILIALAAGAVVWTRRRRSVSTPIDSTPTDTQPPPGAPSMS
jgi:hypothetical protein